MEPGLKIYDQLLQFPLFQGMSHADLMQVVAHTKFDFIRLAKGRRLLHEGDGCRGLLFLIQGTVRMDTKADDGGYRVVEQLSAPYIIQPETLFGIGQHYTSTVFAQTDINLFAISKQDIMLMATDLLVFRLNLFNNYATHTQRQLHAPWRRPPADLRQRIVRFIVDHCRYPAGEKVFYILMNRLAQELNDSRIDVSRALNSLQADGLLKLSRGCIHVPALEMLIQGMA